MPLLLPIIRAATNWKTALTVLYPGGYIITVLLLNITFILIDIILQKEIGLKTVKENMKQINVKI